MEPKKRAPRAAAPKPPAPPAPEGTLTDEQRFRRSPEYQEMQDQLLREKEAKAPTTRSTMGEGKLRLFRAGGLMERKHYDEGGEVEMTAADYDDERPEESLQSRIAKAQSRSPAAPKAAPKPAAKSVPRPAMDQGREGRDRGTQKPAKSVGYSSRPQSFLRGLGVQSYAKGGSVSASRRADGCAQRGKTRGKMI
jgi:hypothetical protein